MWTRTRHSARNPPTTALSATLAAAQQAKPPIDENEPADHSQETLSLLLEVESGVLPSFVSPSSRVGLAVTRGHASQRVLLISRFISPGRVWPVHAGGAKTQRIFFIHGSYKIHNDIGKCLAIRRITTAEPLHEYDAECSARMVSSQAPLLQDWHTSPSRAVQKRIMVHASICRWLFCTTSLFCGLLFAACILEKVDAEQRFTTHLQQWWGLVLRQTGLKHRLEDARLLSLALSQCRSRMLEADFVITALAIPCCSLLHLALSALVVAVRPVRHALRRLEELLAPQQGFIQNAVLVVWRAVLIVLITCVFVAVAAHMS